MTLEELAAKHGGTVDKVQETQSLAEEFGGKVEEVPDIDPFKQQVGKAPENPLNIPGGNLAQAQAGGFGLEHPMGIDPAKSDGHPIGDLLKYLKESVTGEKRSVPETEALPNYNIMPELADVDWGTAYDDVKFFLFEGTAPAEEKVKMIQNIYPDVQADQDKAGNWVLKSAKDGKLYAIKPGFGVSDIPASIVEYGKSLGPARAKTLLGRLGGALGVDMGSEFAQEQMGGEANYLEAGIGSALGSVGEFMPAARRVRGSFSEPIEEASEVSMKSIDDIAIPTKQERKEFGQRSAEAALGRDSATQRFAEELPIDENVLRAAREEGVEELMQPDFLTTDTAATELMQLAKSKSGSPLRQQEMVFLEKIGNQAKKLVEDYGGTDNPGGLSSRVEDFMTKKVKKLENLRENIYNDIALKVPDDYEVSTENIMDFLNSELRKVKGKPENLPSAYREVYNKIVKDESPTYHMLDTLRKSVGAKSSSFGLFTDAKKAQYDRMYGLLTEDQGAGLKGLDERLFTDWERGKAAVRLRKNTERDMKKLFGDKLNKTFVNLMESSNRGLSKTDAKVFIDTINSIPKKFRADFVASSIIDAFRGKSMKINRQDGPINYSGFANWWDNMSRNQNAKNAFLSSLPKGAPKRLENIATLARAIGKARDMHTKTGASLQQFYEPVESLIGKVYDSARRTGALGATGMGIATGDPIMTAVGAASSINSAIRGATRKTADETLDAVEGMLASKEFRDLITTPPDASKSVPVKRLTKSQKFKRFAKAINLPLTDAEAYVLAGLKPTVREFDRKVEQLQETAIPYETEEQ